MLDLRRFAARLVWMVPFAALVSTACEHNPAEVGSLVSIMVTRNPETMAISTTRQFNAMGMDANGQEVAISPTWSVAAGGGAIDNSGVFTAGTVPGTFTNTVKATVGSISGTATAIVTVGPAASITLTPTPVTLALSTNQQFTAVVKDAGGNVLTTAPNWAVSAGGTINSTGLFTAGTVAGTYNNAVTASVGSIAASASVTVTPAALASITVSPNPKILALGAQETFTATGRDANGNLVSITPAWSVQASGGSITTPGGVFTAGTVAGTFANTVKATSGSISGFATVTVSTGLLAFITVTPDPVDVGTNATQQFTAVGMDADSNVIPIVPAPTWSVLPGHAGGSILSSGGYTAPAGAGIDSIRACSTAACGAGSISGFALVNVKATGALVAIVVTPNPASVVAGTPTGSTQLFTATGFDNTGLVVPLPVGLTWSVLASGGTINGGSGLFTAGSATGTFPNTVRACSTAACLAGAIAGYATVIVTAAPPPGPSLGAAETHGLLAGSAFTCADGTTPYSTINADASVWPGSAFTGFPPCVITGATHAADAFAQTAQGDLTTAFLALAAMPCGTTVTADLGGTTLAPGVYCSLSSVGVTGTVTLDGNGDANALFVIRAPSTLTTAGDVILQNGAQAKNVYWWVGSSATLGVNSAWQGNILALTTITLAGNTTLCGRALARNGAVSLSGDNDYIKLPPAAPPTCTFP